MGPVLAICTLAALFWYAVSVSPYRIPLIVDLASAKLTLLHVEKKGSQLSLLHMICVGYAMAKELG